jgi:hypothetical protein
MSGSEGSPRVYNYNFAQGAFLPSTYYGGLGEEIDNVNTRMNRGPIPVSKLPNYMVGTGNQPMHRGGPNLFATDHKGFRNITAADEMPQTAISQNANVFPAMFNHRTGLRRDPQSWNAGLITDKAIRHYPYGQYDKHFDPTKAVGEAQFSGLPSYLGAPSGKAAQYRIVKGEGGYQYKQFANGTIQIVAGPSGIGTVHYTGSQINKAITQEIGAYPSSKSSSGKSIITQLFDTASDVATAVTASQQAKIAAAEEERKKKEQNRKQIMIAAGGVMAALIIASVLR